ncbi:MAG: putative porin [Verrucomicrobiae bacterium]|nr:putative porin [Verrucomicrobiae bacterium]
MGKHIFIKKLSAIIVSAHICVLTNIVGGQTAPTNAAPGESEVLLDLLRKKGVITEQEAKDAEKALKEKRLSREKAAADDFKFKVNKAVKSLEFFGDARLRYEYREGQSSTSDTYARERYRYRLRLGLKSEFTDNFYGGIRIEPSTSQRSALGTFGDDAGPWGKNNDRINIGQLYLGWKPNDWFNMEAGRIANPIYSSLLVWDSDICPEGLTEKFKYSVGDFDLFATFGQFLYDDGDPENPFGNGAIGKESYMFAWQLGANYKINKSMSFQIAPALYTYTGGGDYDKVYNPAAGADSSINDLLILDIPAEFNFKALNLPWKIFGQVAVNLEASDRAAAARAVNPLAYTAAGDENLAYQFGLSIGKSGKKGTWDTRVFWQHTELFSLDPNLVDSDYFNGFLNFEGVGVSLNYSITDNIFFTVSYGYGDRINKRLTTGSGLDLGTFGNTYAGTRMNLFQVDLNWKF